MNRLRPHYLLFLLFLLLTGINRPLIAQNQPDTTQTQKYTFIFKGEPIEQALQRLVQKTSLDLIYDPQIINDFNVFATIRNQKPEAVLRQILKDSGLDFVQLSSGTYVLTTAAKASAKYGNLSGRVIDNQSGEPLAGANVMLADASGGAATNGAGHFTIPKLEEGFHPITITFVGYKPIRDTVWVPGNSTASMQFSLASQPVIVEPIIINGIQKRLPASHAFSSNVGAGEILSQQSLGTTDAVKSLNIVSGIDFSLPLADFNIQGSNNGEHELQLDGVPIYNPVSMGRLLGAFSPYAVRKIEINKAGFSADKGSQLSGIINVKQDVANTAENTLLVQADPMNINGRYDHKFESKNGPTVNLMLASRVNIWSVYKERAVKQTLQDWDQLDPLLTINLLQTDSTDSYFQPRDNSYDITYYDLHAAALIEHNPFHQTRISAYHGKNKLETDLFSENIALANSSADLYYSIDSYNWTNTMGKVEHEWLINSRLNAMLGGYATRHSLDHDYTFTNNRMAGIANDAAFDYPGAIRDYAIDNMDTGDKNAIIESSAHFSLSYSATKDYTIEGGLRATHLNYRYHLSDLYYNAAQSNNSSFLISGYLQNDIFLSHKTILSFGNRFTFVPSRDLVFAEPRVSLQYEEPDASIGYWSGKISGGIYRQFINQFDVSNIGPSALVPSIRFWVPIDYTTTVPKAYHLALDGRWEPTETWKIQLESYYKWIPSRLALDYQKLSAFPAMGSSETYSTQTEFIKQTNGYAFGAGISVNKRIQDLNMEVSGGYQYSLAKQNYTSRFGSQRQPLPSNQPHKVDLSLDWNPMRNMTFLLQWEGIWGRSWGFRQAYYDYLSIRGEQAFGSYSFHDPGNDKLPRYSQLNTGISYQLQAGSSKVQFRLNIFNVLNHENVLNWWLSPVINENGEFTYERKERTMVGFKPSLSIKLSY